MGRSAAILIRHANSTCNKAGAELHKLAETQDLQLERWMTVFGDPSMIDAKLSDEGIGQCLEASILAKRFDFKALMISPMRRTLETAYYMFKDHPNFKDM